MTVSPTPSIKFIKNSYKKRTLILSSSELNKWAPLENIDISCILEKRI